jgi:NADH-quinone oxidoreductase subunit N
VIVALLARIVAQVAPGGGGAAGATGATPTSVPAAVVRGGLGGNPGGASAAAGLPKLVLPNVEYHLLIPQLALIASAVVLVAASSLVRGRWRRGTYAGWTIATGLFSAIYAWHLWGQIVGHSAPKATGGPQAVTAVAHAVTVDGFSLFFVVIVCTALILGSLVAESYLQREGLDGPEFYALAMLCTAGATIMASANDLIVLFLGLEILSISLYVLTGSHLKRIESGEAAIKYFLLGGFSSAFFLYGVALVYGATGSTNIASIATFLTTNVIAHNGVLLAGIALIIVGLGFKVAAVPFHVWTPDVYQGAPSPVTGYMAAAAKAAGFAALLRVLLSAMSTQSDVWREPIGALAVLTLLLGATLAVVQTDIKRMMAYSSINHAGFILLGLWAAAQQEGGGPGTTPAGLAGALFYLLAYTFLVIGTFAVITVVGGEGDAQHQLERYRGLSRQRPLLAVALTILVMGQAGIPFTTGFFAKFYVLSAVVGLGTTWAYVLAVIAMLSTVIATFFYLRIILVTWSAPPDAEGDPVASAAVTAVSGGGTTAVLTRADVQVPATTALALTLCVAFTVAFGLAPGPIIHFATHATLIF